MAALDKNAQKDFDMQNEAITQCHKYFFEQNGAVVASFDSAHIQQDALPQVLVACFDSIGQQYAPQLDLAVQTGIDIYKGRNGGDLPHASVVATALSSAAAINTQDLKGFDSIKNYDQAAIAPAMTVATIISTIANALPIIAMLPNPTKSIRVPVVAVRFATDATFGAMKEGEFLDGPNAAAPYAEGRFKFAMSNGGSGATYSVAAHTAYASFANKTPDTTAPKLPFLSGNVSIRVNGKEVANTRGEHSNSITSGNVEVVRKKPVKIDTVEYRVTDSEVNLTNKTISVTFNTALPPDAKVEVFLVADFDAKQNGAYILTPVGTGVDPEYESIQSVPILTRVRVPFTLQNQLANELGLGFVGAALAQMQGKVFLEQNVRLLTDAKERAKFSGFVKDFDFSKGVAGNFATVGNTTGDLFAEFMKYVTAAKMQINQRTGGSATSFSLYVGNAGATFLSTLSGDRFTKTGLIASYGEIVRIGTLNDGTHVYHTPTEQGIVTEVDTALELALFGNGNDPVRNPFVGTITTPPTFREVTVDSREASFSMHSQMAAEQNPLDRYAEQVVVINVINAPRL